MRIPRFRVRTLMFLVGIIGIAIGGTLEYRRLSKLRHGYLALASGFGDSVQMRHSEYEAAKREFDRLRKDPMPDGMKIELAAARMTASAAQLASNLHIVLIYEHAASHPWETPPDPAAALDPSRSPMLKRFPPDDNHRRPGRVAY